MRTSAHDTRGIADQDGGTETLAAPDDGLPRRPLTSVILRWLLLVTGVLFAALATVGAFLPVLPTTPFLILAGACFVRSSPAFHRRLLANRVFGPYIDQWQRDHTVPREAKRKAYGLVIASFGLSILFVDKSWLRAALTVVGLALLAFLRWLPATGSSGELPDAEQTPRPRTVSRPPEA